MSAVAELRAYLEMVATMRSPPAGCSYTCVEDYVLRNGRTFPSSALTRSEWQVVASAARRAGPMIAKHCFWNAHRLVAADRAEALEYVEGFALSVIPTHHAWVTINGKVVDLTWTLRVGAERRRFPHNPVGELPEDAAYIGVAFPRKAIRDRLRAGTKNWSLIDDWEAGWPLLHFPATTSTHDGTAP